MDKPVKSLLMLMSLSFAANVFAASSFDAAVDARQNADGQSWKMATAAGKTIRLNGNVDRKMAFNIIGIADSESLSRFPILVTYAPLQEIKRPSMSNKKQVYAIFTEATLPLALRNPAAPPKFMIQRKDVDLNGVVDATLLKPVYELQAHVDPAHPDFYFVVWWLPTVAALQNAKAQLITAGYHEADIKTDSAAHTLELSLKRKAD